MSNLSVFSKAKRGSSLASLEAEYNSTLAKVNELEEWLDSQKKWPLPTATARKWREKYFSLCNKLSELRGQLPAMTQEEITYGFKQQQKRAA